MSADLRFLGVDLSPNHSGWVVLGEGGEVLDRVFLTSRKASCKAWKGTGFCLPVPSTRDPELRDLERLDRAFVVYQALLDRLRPSHVGVEGYAFSRSGGHQKGEIGGVFRLAVWWRGLPFRVHDPMTVKKFTAGRGDADKDAMIAAILEAGGPDYGAFADSSKASAEVCEDLADAHAVAAMVRAEFMLRVGRLSLQDLWGYQLEVINRVTDASPVALLQRPWLQDPRDPTLIESLHNDLYSDLCPVST